jgi:hypothetical protein
VDVQLGVRVGRGTGRLGGCRRAGLGEALVRQLERAGRVVERIERGDPPVQRVPRAGGQVLHVDAIAALHVLGAQVVGRRRILLQRVVEPQRAVEVLGHGAGPAALHDGDAAGAQRREAVALGCVDGQRAAVGQPVDAGDVVQRLERGAVGIELDDVDRAGHR